MIYFDNAATHPLLPQVKAQIPYYLEIYGNPSSTHVVGQEAKKAIESARRSVADYLGCQSEQIIFTSGTTEGNNLVIFAMESLGYTSFSTALEHPSLLCKHRIEHTTEGYATLNPIKNSFYELTPKNRLYCISWVNNEIGITQKVADYCYRAHSEGNMVLVDATAAIGFDSKFETNWGEVEGFCKRYGKDYNNYGSNIPDFITFSGHKIGSLKGVGVLYCKNPLPKISLGGHQEGNSRPGTQNVLGILSLQDALVAIRTQENIDCNYYTYNEKMSSYNTTEHSKLKIPMWLAISNYIYAFLMNNHKEMKPRIYSTINSKQAGFFADSGHIINVSFAGVDSFALQQALSNYDICVSNGAACEGAHVTYSHVLEAMGWHEQGSIRISIGFNNTLKDAQILCETLKELVKELRVT